MARTASTLVVSWAFAVAAGLAAELPSGLDVYGGWLDVPARATGWFHLETMRGRVLLVTPAGHGFVALGVNHLNAIRTHGADEPDLFRTRYGGDWQRFAAAVLQRYAEWGFNTVDDGVEPLRRARPYFAARDFVRTAKYYGPPGAPNAWDFPDVFDPDVTARLEREVAAFCNQHRNERNLIAYLWTDTPTWDVRKTRQFRQTDWVSEIRKLRSTAAGKLRYVEFLRESYTGDIARFNRAYGMRAESFEALAAWDFATVERDRYEVVRDDENFLGEIARRYYGIVGPAMRRSDPHHLVFGEKYLLGDIPPQVIAAALPHIDAVAVQPGDGYIPIYTPGDIYPSAEFAALHAVTGKPIFICDHQISFATPRYPVAIWPYQQRRDETDAAAATELFLREAFAQPFIVGYMRCQYVDRFADRRRAIKLGLVRDDDSPYTDLTAAIARATAAIARQVRDTAGRRRP